MEKFGAAVNKSLDYLEGTLPPGSTVILIGLAQGTLLFDTTAEAIHPLGTPYPAFYEYMSCMGVNPCWGWLNTNATWRNATQARADQLNQEYGRIVAARRGTFKSFKLLYFNPDLRRLIEQYVASGPDRKALDCGASFPLRGPCLESRWLTEGFARSGAVRWLPPEPAAPAAHRRGDLGLAGEGAS